MENGSPGGSPLPGRECRTGVPGGAGGRRESQRGGRGLPRDQLPRVGARLTCRRSKRPAGSSGESSGPSRSLGLAAEPGEARAPDTAQGQARKTAQAAASSSSSSPATRAQGSTRQARARGAGGHGASGSSAASEAYSMTRDCGKTQRAAFYSCLAIKGGHAPPPAATPLPSPEPFPLSP